MVAARRVPVPAAGAWSPLLVQARPLHTTLPAQEGVLAFNQLQKTSKWEDKTVELARMIETFRQLQAVELLRNPKPGSEAQTEYRNAERVLYQLGHEKDVKKLDKTKIRLSELHDVLPESQGRAWRTIREMVDRGKVGRLEELDKEGRAKIAFLRISHIGKTYADKFYAAGARTLKDLEAEKKVKLTHAQRVCLHHYEDMEQLIPRSEVEEIKDVLFQAVKKVDPKLEGDILGSYRRGNAFSSDVDLILRHPDISRDAEPSKMKEVLEAVVAELGDRVVDQTAFGPKIFRGLFRLTKKGIARRLDIAISGYENYPYKLLGSTGDDRLMRLMRRRAEDLKLFLNEEGMGDRVPGKGTAEIWDPDTFIEVEDEKGIFEALQLPYLEPSQRNFATYGKMKEYREFQPLGDKKKR